MAALRPIEFQILLSLATGERHGYAIILDIAERSLETVETGTLYRAIQRLTEEDLVRPVAVRPAPGDDERRQYYAITAAGRQAATAEARRMAALVDAAREARLLPRAT